MIDVDLTLCVADHSRHFTLSARFSTNAPFTALYGPSGSGKTLTFQSIAGLMNPIRGHIRVGERMLFDASADINVPSYQRRIGYLFQNYALFPHLSVRENIAFGLTSWRQRRLSAQQSEQIEMLLESFDLASMAESRPKTLSGGQQQRVALARTLACQPQILLLDEPFSALNPMLRHALRKELADVQKKWNIPVLMITHDIEDVLALADIAFIYQAGQIRQKINLHDATGREFVLQQRDAHLPESTPLREKLRRMLLGDVGVCN